MQKYVCPKCHAVVWSGKEVKYCVCGGKYLTTLEVLEQLFGDAFGGVK